MFKVTAPAALLFGLLLVLFNLHLDQITEPVRKVEEADSEQESDVAADLGHEREERVEELLLADHDAGREVVEDFAVGLTLVQQLMVLGAHSAHEDLEVLRRRKKKEEEEYSYV